MDASGKGLTRVGEPAPRRHPILPKWPRWGVALMFTGIALAVVAIVVCLSLFATQCNHVQCGNGIFGRDCGSCNAGSRCLASLCTNAKDSAPCTEENAARACSTGATCNSNKCSGGTAPIMGPTCAGPTVADPDPADYDGAKCVAGDYTLSKPCTTPLNVYLWDESPGANNLGADTWATYYSKKAAFVSGNAAGFAVNKFLMRVEYPDPTLVAKGESQYVPYVGPDRQFSPLIEHFMAKIPAGTKVYANLYTDAHTRWTGFNISAPTPNLPADLTAVVWTGSSAPQPYRSGFCESAAPVDDDANPALMAMRLVKCVYDLNAGIVDYNHQHGTNAPLFSGICWDKEWAGLGDPGCHLSYLWQFSQGLGLSDSEKSPFNISAQIGGRPRFGIALGSWEVGQVKSWAFGKTGPHNDQAIPFGATMDEFYMEFYNITNDVGATSTEKPVTKAETLDVDVFAGVHNYDGMCQTSGEVGEWGTTCAQWDRATGNCVKVPWCSCDPKVCGIKCTYCHVGGYLPNPFCGTSIYDQFKGDAQALWSGDAAKPSVPSMLGLSRTAGGGFTDGDMRALVVNLSLAERSILASKMFPLFTVENMKGADCYWPTGTDGSCKECGQINALGSWQPEEIQQFVALFLGEQSKLFGGVQIGEIPAANVGIFQTSLIPPQWY